MICPLTRKAKIIFCQETAVNKRYSSRFIFFISILFLCSATALAQQAPEKTVSLGRIVSISFPKNNLEEVIYTLSAEYNLNFSYINNEIPLKNIVCYTAVNQSLRTVLDSVCKQASVAYYIVGTQIVLKRIDLPIPVVDADSAQIINHPVDSVRVPSDTVLVRNGHRYKPGSYRKNKDYNKYFIAVYGKRKVYDSIVVKTKITEDSLHPEKNTHKYVYVTRRYIRHLENVRNVRELFSISVFAGPGFSYRTLTSPEKVVTDRNESESKIANLFTGVYISYYTEPHVSLRTGLTYLNVGEKGAYSETYTVVPPNAHSSNVPSYKTIDYSYKNQYNYLIVPLMVGYTFDISRKFHTSVYSGFSVAFLLKRKSNYQDTTSNYVPSLNIPRSPYAHSYNKLSMVLPIQIDIGYQLSSKLQAFVLPSFNYFLTSIYTKDDAAKEKPYAFNFSLGLRIMFDRH